MTARLPVPGGDDGDWGDILNQFLSVSHNSDGTLLPGAVEQAGAVLESSVGAANGVAALNGSSQVPTGQLGSGTASNSNFLRGDGTWAVPSGGAVTSVFGRTGVVTAQSGDYTAAQVGALPSTDDLSAIAAANATAANVSLNSHKITNLADGASASDAAAFGQVPTSAGAIGGLVASSNLSDVNSASTALGNLGGMPKAGGTFTGAVIPSTVALTDAATISLDASLANIFTLTLTGNHTLGTPTNPAAHQMIIIEVTQDATGSRTLAYSSAYAFSAGAPAPILSSAAAATDYLLFIYSGTATKWRFLDARLGY